MRVASADPAVPAFDVTPPPPPSEGAAGSTGEPSFVAVLHGLGREIDRGEASTRAAIDSLRAGRELGPGHLIALQVGVYRYSETVDLAARLVDRATSSVKTVVQGGGQ